MGFASYFEDILDRLDQDLRCLRRSMETRGADKESRRLLASMAHAESLLREMTNRLDVLTDPTIDMPERLAHVEREIQDLKAQLATVRSDAESEKAALAIRLQRTRAERDAARKKQHEVQDKLDRIRRQRR